MMRHTELATAIHEAGHAVAITVAFRNARWLPKPPPALLATRVAS
jgi:hypothetical protein